ncbi:MAG TPA: Gfo/Idh/MocA family oxidoreductase [Candidatus Methylomirabilis sp.]|nr:Gfo/Idh/MocA family oxidoreductase [Candidatus Methylomirabilis sp.]
MLRVAIAGCGKIADAHVAQIQRIDRCEIVGVCDRELLMAKQLYERFPVQRYYADVSELLSEARPDVVHVTTPPESHFDLARFCLERGCHVYVEKPFTLNAVDAHALITLANERGLRLTAGHDDQFSHVARRMRALVHAGYLGGPPVHVEGHLCYDLDDMYARAMLGDKTHWVRALPGKLLQNVISHGIARIAEFLTAEAPRVIAYGFVSPRLQAMGETDIVDELRAIISEEHGPTAYFTFSSQMRPVLHQLRVYGPANGLILDQDQETLIKLRGRRFKSYVENFVPPVIFAGQHLGAVAANLKTFMARDFHTKSGLKYLIESFYRSILDGTPVPIPYGEILRTARIMDSIFDQLGAARTPARIESPA